jgi:gas vesicle protein
MNQSRTLCFFLGVSVGAAVALLYAPQKGARVRGMVASKAKQGQKFVQDQSEQLRSQAEQLRDEAKDRAERVKETMARAAEGIKATVDAGRKVFAT